MSNITILSTTPGKLAGAVNKALAEGLSKSVSHFCATPCGTALSLVLTEQPGKNRDTSGSIHEVSVISGTSVQVETALSKMDSPYAKVIGLASHAAAKKNGPTEGEQGQEGEEGDQAKKQAKPGKPAVVRFHALVATFQP